MFTAIGGSRLTAARLAVLGLVCTATLGCLLAALSPILWLFAVSTEKSASIIIISCVFAALSLVFAARPAVTAVQKGIVATKAGLNVWLVVFAVVALQTVTLVRPMLAPIGSQCWPCGKCFFIEHFISAVM